MDFTVRHLPGRVPRVAGTIISAEYLREWERNPVPLPCDVVEFRLDGFPDFPDWLEIGKKIEAAGTPVFVTARLAKEGGFWKQSDRERVPHLERALNELSGVDVELDSEIAREIAVRARERGKLLVISSHHFESTPPLPWMQQFIGQAHALGGIAKLAAKANSEEDLANLRLLLPGPGSSAESSLPVCIIGMGPLGRETRLTFPRLGSCLTYGYLDSPGAPGQYSAQELRANLREPNP